MVRTWGKWTAVVLLGFAVVASGCSSSGDDAETATVADTGDDAAGEVSEGAAVAGGGSDASGVVGAVPASVSLPRVIRTATIRLEVDDRGFSKAFSEVATIASGAGGFVASSSSAAGAEDDLASGSLTLRVPADAFDDVRRRIRDLGDLQSEDIAGQDVGGQIADLEARLRNLRAQEEAIRALMARTANVPETLQIQNQLSTVREQIEQLDGHRARLEDQVAFATLTVHLSEPGAAPRGDGLTISEALANAIDGAETITAGAIVALGYLLPVALVAVVVFGMRRAIARQRPVARPASVEHGA